jgi:hypothetical protein
MTDEYLDISLGGAHSSAIKVYVRLIFFRIGNIFFQENHLNQFFI